MKQQKKILSIFVKAAVGIAMVSSIGCVKKRADKFIDNSGLDKGTVVSKASFKKSQRGLILETGNSTGEKDYTYKLTVEESLKSEFNDLGYVEYHTSSGLIPEGTKIRGVENAKYEIKYEISGDKLYIYKVGKKESIPFYEVSSKLMKPYGNSIGVPIVMCDVEHYNVVKQKDADGRKTNESSEVSEEEPSLFASATHIKISKSSCEAISYKEKAELLPFSIFDRKNMQLSMFKINSSDYELGGNSFVGIYDRDTDTWGVLRRAKAERLDPKTLSITANALPPELSTKEGGKRNESNRLTLLPFSVEWRDFRLNKLASGTVEEIEDTSKDYKSASYVKVDYAETFRRFVEKSGVSSVFTGNSMVVNSVKEIIIGKDIFSVIFSTKEGKVDYRINLSVHDDGVEYIATAAEEKDGELFGTFNIETPVHDKSKIVNTVEDKQRIFRKMRFNPKKKEIVYYISAESPRNPIIENVARESIRRLNLAFKNAVYKDAPKATITIKLSKKRVRRGDPRYNIIDFNSENNFRTALGLGMPHFDEVTGEVLSAITYTYFGAYKRIVRNDLLEYLEVESGLKDPLLKVDTTSYGRAQFTGKIKSQTVPMSPFHMNASALEFLQEQASYAKGFSYVETLKDGSGLKCSGEGCASQLADFKKRKDMARSSFASNTLNKSWSSNADFCSRAEAEHRDVKFYNLKRYCGDLSGLIEKFRNRKGSAKTLEDERAKACVDKYLTVTLIQTTVHELIHNFGVAHNFQGSADEDNHLTKDLIKEVYGDEITYEPISIKNSSSIMDYEDGSEYPSQYDWAVLRYIYRDAVEAETRNDSISLVEGQFVDAFGVKVTKLKPIAKAILDSGKKVREYEFCSDFDASFGVDPMCARWDKGSNPEEAVKNLVGDFKYVTKYYSTKGISSGSTNNVAAYQLRAISRMSEFYKKWRVHLYDLLGEKKKYLEGMRASEDFYNTFAEAMHTLKPEEQKRILEYYNARTEIYKLYRDVIFEAPLTCVMLFDKSLYPVDFDQAYSNLSASVNLRNRPNLVTGCDSKDIIEESRKIVLKKLSHLTGDVSGVRLKDISYANSVGTPFYSYSYDVNNNATDFEKDITGIWSAKTIAMQALSMRMLARVFNKSEYFAPNMLDEPEIRENFEHLIKYRINHGYWVNLGEMTSSLGEIRVDKELTKILLANPKNKMFLRVKGVDAKLRDLPQEKMVIDVLQSIYVQNDALKSLLDSGANAIQAFTNLFQVVPNPAFITESSLLNSAFTLFRMGLNVPGDSVETKIRAKSFDVGVYRAEFMDLERAKERHGVATEIKESGFYGDMIIYPRDDEALFAREAILELDGLNGVSYLEPLGEMSPGAVDAYSKHMIGLLRKRFSPDEAGAPPNLTLQFYSDLFEDITILHNDLLKTEFAKESLLTKKSLAAGLSVQQDLSAKMVRFLNAQEGLIKTKSSDGYALTYSSAIGVINRVERQFGNANELAGSSVLSFLNGKDATGKIATEMAADIKEVYTSFPLIADEAPVVSPKEILDSMGTAIKGKYDELQFQASAHIQYKAIQDELDEKKVILNEVLKVMAWF